MMEEPQSLCSAEGSRVRAFGRNAKFCRADGTRLRAFSTKTERLQLAHIVRFVPQGIPAKQPPIYVLLSGSSGQVGWTPSHTGITGNEQADAAAKLAAFRRLPLVLLAPPLADPRPTPPGAAGLAQTKGRLSVLPHHKALCHLHPPSPRSYTSLSDEASRLLPPGPSKLASPRPGALPSVRGGDRDH